MTEAEKDAHKALKTLKEIREDLAKAIAELEKIAKGLKS